MKLQYSPDPHTAGLIHGGLVTCEAQAAQFWENHTTDYTELERIANRMENQNAELVDSIIKDGKFKSRNGEGHKISFAPGVFENWLDSYLYPTVTPIPHLAWKRRV